ncbi:hypothetical protein HK104_009959 [Borealophlyctis nickersoniae]|nr:hypothetical protein HK104_009959 [Borealophlyctis nickersoniae]
MELLRELISITTPSGLNPKTAWLALAAALTSSNRPSHLSPLLQCLFRDYAPKLSPEEKDIEMATGTVLLERIQEAVLKVYVPGNWNAKGDDSGAGALSHRAQNLEPKIVKTGLQVINALTVIRDRAQLDAADALAILEATTVERRDAVDFEMVTKWKERGEAMFDKVYGSSYGKETELIMVAALRVQGGPVEKQTESHRRGAIKMGATPEEVAAVQNMVDSMLTRIGQDP